MSLLHALSALVAARIMNMTGLLEHVSIPARKMLPLSLVTAAAVGSGSGQIEPLSRPVHLWGQLVLLNATLVLTSVLIYLYVVTITSPVRGRAGARARAAWTPTDGALLTPSSSLWDVHCCAARPCAASSRFSLSSTSSVRALKCTRRA